VTVNDDAWIVNLATFVNIDGTALLGDQQRARIESGEVFVGRVQNDDAGVEIDLVEVGDDGPGDMPRRSSSPGTNSASTARPRTTRARRHTRPAGARSPRRPTLESRPGSDSPSLLRSGTASWRSGRT
jgi:hypothetical protein